MRIKLIIVLLLSGVSIYSAAGQAGVGRLTVKVKTTKEYQGLWDSIIVANKDTVLRLAGGKITTVMQLPQGQYTVTLKSRVNGMLSKEVILKNSAAIEFNTLKYYKPYKDTVSIFNKMKDGDTCFINYTNGANKFQTIEYFMVVKEGEKYLTLSKNEINQWWSIQVFDYELQEFIGYGKYQGAVKTADKEGLGVYYCSLNRQLLRRDCGICLYGFMLRKHLVKEK